MEQCSCHGPRREPRHHGSARFRLQLGSPKPGAARLEHKTSSARRRQTLNPNIKRNSMRPQEASLEPFEESGEAYLISGRVTWAARAL